LIDGRPSVPIGRDTQMASTDRAQIGDLAIHFTNSPAYMTFQVAVISLLTIRHMKARQPAPGRFQATAELSYVAVAAQ
jgi:F0F1-type ATP synthase membrane subunit a